MQKLESVSVVATQWNGNTKELKAFFNANRVLVDDKDNATVVKNIERTDKNGAIEYKKTLVKAGSYCIKASEDSTKVVVLSEAEASIIFGFAYEGDEQITAEETATAETEAKPEQKSKSNTSKN